MNKFIFMMLSITIFTLISSSAAIYKGQRVFVKQCLECHTDCQNFVEKHTMQEWKDFTKEEGKPLAELHVKSSKAKNSYKYFKSTQYTKKLKHLRQFLIEYAKDSGNVPACN